MKTKFFLLMSLAALQISQAAIVYSFEAAGVQQTTVANTTSISFDLLGTGSLGSYNTTIGSYGSGGTIVNGNAYGGANQTRYIAVGAQSGTTSFTLSFFGDLDYFGFNWQAADSKNEVRFYNNGALVQTFTSSILSSLSPAYNGNPNNGQNKGEKYAFVNFSTTNGTVFDQVVFYNNGTSTGFETDNHTVKNSRIPGSEVATPEPSTYALCGIALLTVGFYRRRKATPAKM
jgi:hypothetical protein